MENIIINIDSVYRDIETYPNAGLFTYKLKDAIKNITYIRLSSIELPVVYYTFTSKYQNISFRILFGNQTYDLVIQEGNYDSVTILTEIQSKLDIANQLYGTSFTINWDIINYKITITNKTAFTLFFDNDNIQNHRSLGNRLGFRKDNQSYLANSQKTKFDNNTNTNVYFWTGETIMDISKDNYLFLRINDYGVIYNDNRGNGILAKLLLYDTQFVIETGANFITKSYTFKQPVTISKFDIELINKRGETVDMSMIEFSMTLELGQIYDKNQYSNFDFQVN